MDTGEIARRNWIRKTLGVVFPDDGPDAAQSSAADAWQAAAGAWRSASDAVDAQIGALQSALNASGDAELVQIAGSGLNGLTGRYKVRTMATIADIGDGRGATPKQAKTGLAVMRDFRAHLAGSELIAAVDANPFGVPVNIAGTLGPVLERMETALGRLAA